MARAGTCDRKLFVRIALEIGRAEFLAGRITAAESVSRTNLENALLWFLDREILVEENKKLKLGPRGEDEAERTKLAADIRAFLQR